MEIKESNLHIFRSINEDIVNGCTGSTEEFAFRLNLSKSSLKRYLGYIQQKIKKFAVNLVYDRERKSYLYSRKFSFKASIRIDCSGKCKVNL